MRQIILDFNLDNSYVQSISVNDTDTLPNAEFKILSSEDLSFEPGCRDRIILPINNKTVSPAADLFMQPSMRTSMIMAGYQLSELMYVNEQWMVIVDGVSAHTSILIEKGDIMLTGRYVTRTNVRVF